jgi:SAM-dependent methyltransferase
MTTIDPKAEETWRGTRTVTDCPACGSSSFHSTGPEAPGFSAIIDCESFDQPNYAVRECSDCALLYRDRTLSQEDLDRYYAKVDFRKWDFADYHPTERRVLEILRQLPRASRILDFGCSSGRLLAGLCAEYQCYGVEVNEAASKEAAKRGIQILASDDLENSNLPNFDAIVLVDLFEHMSQPLDFLRRLSRSLSDNGQLIIVTGNGDASACRRDPAQFWYFRTVEHLCMFTRKHAEFICSALSLRIEQWTESSHYDLSWRAKLVQRLQDFVYWQFRRRTLLARTALKFLPGMDRLKTGDVAPAYTYSRDHVIAVFSVG